MTQGKLNANNGSLDQVDGFIKRQGKTMIKMSRENFEQLRSMLAQLINEQSNTVDRLEEAISEHRSWLDQSQNDAVHHEWDLSHSLCVERQSGMIEGLSLALELITNSESDPAEVGNFGLPNLDVEKKYWANNHSQEAV